MTVGGLYQPMGKDVDPALVCECFDEDKLGEGEWYKGEGESGESCQDRKSVV